MSSHSQEVPPGCAEVFVTLRKSPLHPLFTRDSLGPSFSISPSLSSLLNSQKHKRENKSTSFWWGAVAGILSRIHLILELPMNPQTIF